LSDALKKMKELSAIRVKNRLRKSTAIALAIEVSIDSLIALGRVKSAYNVKEIMLESL
jgi:hypothetical protein